MRPKLVLLVAVILATPIIGLAYVLGNTTQEQPKATAIPTPVSLPATYEELDLLFRTNEQRSQNGLNRLTFSQRLHNAATTKCKDMVARDYFSHDTPDGEEPFAFITRAGYPYKAAGENIGYGYDTPEQVMTAWMNSPPHKEALLNPIYTQIGFGVCTSDNYRGEGPKKVFVQFFSTPVS